MAYKGQPKSGQLLFLRRDALKQNLEFSEDSF